MTIISQFANQDKTTNVLQGNDSLRRFAHEYCHEFGMKVMQSSHRQNDDSAYRNNELRIVTPNGIEIGHLGIYRHHSESENHYRIYLPNVIKKEKGSKRSGTSERDADKLTALLRTLKKNKEIPSEENIVRSFKTPIRYALNRIVEVPDARVALTSEVTLALIQKLLGVTNFIDPAHQEQINEAYDKYLKAKAKKDQAANDIARIGQGFDLVGIMGNSNTGYHYLVTTGWATSLDSDGILIHPRVTRYNSLADSPLAATAMMIRTYAEGKSFESENELKLPWRDYFYSDLDIGTGYQSREQGLWVVIPKHGE